VQQSASVSGPYALTINGALPSAVRGMAATARIWICGGRTPWPVSAFAMAAARASGSVDYFGDHQVLERCMPAYWPHSAAMPDASVAAYTLNGGAAKRRGKSPYCVGQDRLVEPGAG
jgi:hypothetical protein